jgi:hypothetical protein
MNAIEPFISPFIPRQFPAFYNDEGPNFVSFVQAYYEWLEQSNQAVGQSRKLLDTANIDQAEASFLTYFKNEYMNSLPENIVADKRLLVKHIQELYRSKGTPRSYDLLFRMLFNESIELYQPGQHLFKLSANDWQIPQYIETTYSPNLVGLIGKDIENAAGTASAVVETYTLKTVNGKQINVLYITSVSGKFKFGDRIISQSLVDSNGIPLINVLNAPIINGSLSAIAIEDGGYNFNVGDALQVNGSGVEGVARVASVVNENGKVQFTIINGGSGFGTGQNSIVTVTPILGLGITDVVGSFSYGDTITEANTSATGTLASSNSTIASLINFSSINNFKIGDSINNGLGSSATITSTFGGGGAGATFSVGAVTNKEVVSLNTDVITPYVSTTIDISMRIGITITANTFTVGDTVRSNANNIILEGVVTSANNVANNEALSNSSLGISGLYVYRSDNGMIWCTGTDTNLTNANLVSGTILVSNTSSSTFLLIVRPDKLTSNASGIVTSSNSTSVTIATPNSEFITTSVLINVNNSQLANIESQTRLNNWIFPLRQLPLLTNLDTKINEALAYITQEVGTISLLSNINPGVGYSTNPFVDVINPLMSIQGLDDGIGGLKGHNANVASLAVNANGIVTSVQVIGSGFGYNPAEVLQLSAANNPAAVRGVAVVDTQGIGLGGWKNNNSFLDNITKIQDSQYYQYFSYEIVANRMINTYETFVRDLIHPAGVALFGRYKLSDEQLDNSEIMSVSISQS